MERVLIVAKTHMGPDKACVGALSLHTCKNVRLLLPGNNNHPADTHFDVGQVWQLDLRPSTRLTPPHVEDMIVYEQKPLGLQTNMRGKLLQHIEPWRGGLTQLFDGCLQSDGNSCFISRQGGIPSCSTGYWLTTIPLTLTSIHEKASYAISSYISRKERIGMNIAVFADLHGRLLLAFKLCARWQRETGKKIDLILQAGDLGAYPALERLDRATRRYAERDPTELGFMEHFVRYDARVAALLAETDCPLVFVRGNHEDQAWLDELEGQYEGAIFPIDAYRRVFHLKTGLPWTFQQGDEQITVLGIGRIAPPQEAEDQQHARYIQPYESERIYRLGNTHIDVLLTHHSRTDFVILERGVKIKASTGMKEIEYILDRDRPAYHFFGHYGGPPQVRTDTNGVTLSVKLADLHWERGGSVLEAGSMGLLRWRDCKQHSFEVLDAPWLKDYNAHTWNDV